jgi:hypothetical protein
MQVQNALLSIIFALFWCSYGFSNTFSISEHGRLTTFYSLNHRELVTYTKRLFEIRQRYLATRIEGLVLQS